LLSDFIWTYTLYYWTTSHFIGSEKCEK